MTIGDLPALNATLNATAAAFQIIGYVMVRTGRIAWHKACMLAATLTSALFLVSYLVYHFNIEGVTRFAHTGPIKVLYLAILSTHSVLAVVVLPLVIASLWYGLTDAIERHRRIARWSLALWLYVSVTGVTIYYMLYVWFPAAA